MFSYGWYIFLFEPARRIAIFFTKIGLRPNPIFFPTNRIEPAQYEKKEKKREKQRGREGPFGTWETRPKHRPNSCANRPGIEPDQSRLNLKNSKSVCFQRKIVWIAADFRVVRGGGKGESKKSLGGDFA